MTLPVFLKTAGSLAVLLTGWFAGDWAARDLERQLAEMNRFESALSDLASEISYSLSPLPEALSRVGERVGGQTGQLLWGLGKGMGLGRRKTPEEALAQILGDSSSSVASLPLLMEPLKDLMRSLGTSGQLEQLRHIQVVAERVRGQRRNFEGQVVRKTRVFRYLGVFSGACMTIVLL